MRCPPRHGTPPAPSRRWRHSFSGPLLAPWLLDCPLLGNPSPETAKNRKEAPSPSCCWLPGNPGTLTAQSTLLWSAGGEGRLLTHLLIESSCFTDIQAEEGGRHQCLSSHRIFWMPEASNAAPPPTSFLLHLLYPNISDESLL